MDWDSQEKEKNERYICDIKESTLHLGREVLYNYAQPMKPSRIPGSAIVGTFHTSSTCNSDETIRFRKLRSGKCPRTLSCQEVNKNVTSGKWKMADHEILKDAWNSLHTAILNSAKSLMKIIQATDYN